jgi:hypothetical protein
MTPRTPLATKITKATIVSEAKKAHEVKIQRKASEWNMAAQEAT